MKNSLCIQILRSHIGSVTGRYTRAAAVSQTPNFVAWYKEWNYGIFAEGATYIRLGGHHILVSFIFARIYD